MTDNTAIGTSELAGESRWARDVLDRDYDARATVGDKFAAEMDLYRERSAAEANWLTYGNVVYDELSGQTLDIYGAARDGRPKPVFIFVHGGYWRALSKKDSAMMAGMFARHGIATAVVEYGLAPDVNLREITRQVRAATKFLYQHGDRFNLNSSSLHIGGSSAGAHLAASVLEADWQRGEGLPEQIVRSAVLLSGLYELAPIAAAFPQDWLSLTSADIRDLSPIRNIPDVGCPALVVWAELEPAGFKRQSLSFAKEWMNRGFDVGHFEVPGRNHFDLLLDLGDAHSMLGCRAIEMIARC